MNNNPEKVTEEFMTCGICKSRHGHKAPTAMLTCGHSFCRACLEASPHLMHITPAPYNHNCSMKTIRCPVCCLPSALPPGGLKGLSRCVMKEMQMDHLLRRHNRALDRHNALYHIEKFCYDRDSLSAQFHC